MTPIAGTGKTNPTASECAGAPELSVVIPCLNEADTVEACVRRARSTLEHCGVAGEVIVADNGSTDESAAIASRAGARVVKVAARGYGNALMGAIAAARGKYIIMGDADGSYDFAEIPRFLEKLRQGCGLVQGCRMPAGGGAVMSGAMPFLHRWIGNPLFSGLARRWFQSPIHDVNCGLRGFSKAHFERIDQRCTGMEFAAEMIIKSCLFGALIAEVPVTLHRDGRRTHPPHLKTIRDGWRTLRFYLLCSPRRLFFLPGAILAVLGLIGFAVALPGLRLNGVTFDVHTLLFASLAVLCGYQTILFGMVARRFAIHEGILPDDAELRRLFRFFTLETGLVIAVIALLAGLTLLGLAVNQWRMVDFGNLNYAHTMRYVVPGATLTALGFQTIIASFLATLLELADRPARR